MSRARHEARYPNGLRQPCELKFPVARRGGVYYVHKPFDLPDGMGGANARTFILPAGAALPGGPQGHNTFLRMDGFRCEGTGCP